MTDSPTLSMDSALHRAFDHFNEQLFDNELPPCLITLRSSRRQRGYHHAERFISRDGTITHELGVHPGYFTLNPLEVALSTLVHEMVHHWQECFGRPSRSNHHNREWVGKMEAIGLVPSDTGLPDGKQTGRRVTHYIQPDGPFARACGDLRATGFKLPWFDRHAPPIRNRLPKCRRCWPTRVWPSPAPPRRPRRSQCATMPTNRRCSRRPRHARIPVCA